MFKRMVVKYMIECLYLRGILASCYSLWPWVVDLPTLSNSNAKSGWRHSDTEQLNGTRLPSFPPKFNLLRELKALEAMIVVSVYASDSVTFNSRQTHEHLISKGYRCSLVDLP